MSASGMTISEFFRLFGRTVVDGRELASAELTEYLALVTYIVSRDATLDNGDLRSRLNPRSGSLLASAAWRGRPGLSISTHRRCRRIVVRAPHRTAAMGIRIPQRLFAADVTTTEFAE